MRKLFKHFVFLIVLTIISTSVNATNYYVATTGNDSNSGLDSTNAWATINNGDVKGLLNPNDTILVYGGTYNSTGSISIAINGTAGNNIVYKNFDDNAVILDGMTDYDPFFQIDADYTTIDGISFTRGKNIGIKIRGSYCIVKNSKIFVCGADGIRVEEANCLIYNNVIFNITDHGIHGRDSGPNIRIYNNTIYSCGKNGIEFQSDKSLGHVVNNIVILNDKGISGKIENVCAFNNVWNNAVINYNDEVVDSAGGIAVDPQFTDSTNRDFSLLDGSLCIDAGMDLGYPFNGTAPDMGAIESSNPNQPPVLATIGPQSVNENTNLNFTATALDAESTPVLSALDLPTGATFLDNGDGTGTFDWSPTYLQSGSYEITLYATDDSSAVDSEVVTITVIEAGNQNPMIILPGPPIVNENSNLNLAISSSDIESTPSLTTSSLPTGATFIDNGDGTGTFDWTPTCVQSGVYNLMFYATDDSSAVDSGNVLITVNSTPTNFYVSPIGSDDSTGLTPGSSWLSIDNGDTKGLLEPGDTINVAAGTYSASVCNHLTVSGTATLPIVYQRYGSGDAIIDHGGADTCAVHIFGNHINFSGIEIVNAGRDGILLEGDSCFISECKIHNYILQGLDIEGDDNVIIRNQIYNAGQSGVVIRSGAENNKVYNNTIDNCPFQGIWISSFIANARVFNNIIASSNTAIDGPAPAVYGFNCTWNIAGSHYANGSSDSAGGISSNPLFTSEATYDFSLLPGSPCIDAGLDLGYYFEDIAPDMGALESIPHTYIRIEYSDGTPVGDTVLSTDNDTTEIFCRAYDATWTLLGNIGVTWSMVGDSVGLFSVDTGASITLNVRTPGTSKIAAFRTPGFVDTTGTITVAAGFPVTVDILPDTLTISADSTYTFTAISLDADGNPSYPSLTPTWSVIGLIGTIDSLSGLFTPSLADTGNIVVTGTGLSDTTGAIVVIPGDLARISITPDSAIVSADSSLEFKVQGYDSKDNPRTSGTITYGVTNSLGSFDGSGIFTANLVGVGKAFAESNLGPVDTTTYLEVTPGNLTSISIAPDTVTVSIGDSVQFSAIGYDSDLNETDAGIITWDALGRAGSIGSDGLYISNNPGLAKVTAVSSIGSIADTSGFITVEELYLTTISIGNIECLPSSDMNTLLSFRLENYYNDAKLVSGLTLRDTGSGVGSNTQLIANIDSLYLYLDTDNDSLLTIADSLIASSEYGAANIMTFAPLSISPDSGITLLASVKVAKFPRDNDTLDLYIVPSTDFVIVDGSPVTGPTICNSLGYGIINGMVAEQIVLSETNTLELLPTDIVKNVLTIDIPRNGYAVDILNGLSIINEGTATEPDFDSLTLYQDNGNSVWNNTNNEIYVGSFAFTGEYWTISGLNVDLSNAQNRFFVGADVSDFPTNGATISLGVPQNGITVASANDGPIDAGLASIDTVLIQSFEELSIETVKVGEYPLVPGSIDNVITVLNLTNSYNSVRTIDSLDVSLYLINFNTDDPVTIGQLDSQIDLVKIYKLNNADFTEIGDNDSLLASAPVTNGKALLDLSGYQLAANGDRAYLALAVDMNIDNSKNGNLVNVGLNDETDIYMAEATTTSATYPVKNSTNFSIDGFSTDQVAITPIPSQTIRGGEANVKIFEFSLPGNGYLSDILSGMILSRSGTLDEEVTLKLWTESDDIVEDTDILLGEFSPSGASFIIDKISQPIAKTGRLFYITIDVANSQFRGGTFEVEIPIGGIIYQSGMTGPDNAALAMSESDLVIPSNRIFLFSNLQASQSIYPGSSENTILAFALYNGYIDQDQTLQSLLLTNNTITQSSASFADYELGELKVYFDTNKNRILDDDSLLATGYFTDGELSLNGLDLTIPADSQAYLIITANTPLDIIDGDSLSVVIDQTSDISFSGDVNLNGDFPISSGNYMIVDGSIAEQYTINSLSTGTLIPGETAIPLFSFKPAINGDLIDNLTHIDITNNGDADSSDISELSLWIDKNGDDTYQPEDSLIGAMTYGSSVWSIDGLNIEVSEPAKSLFVVGSIDTSASDDRIIQLGLPLNGCLYDSDNDGPIDSLKISDDIFVISTSNLSVKLLRLNEAYSIGQTIDLGITATNIGDTTINNIIGELINVSAPNLITLDSASAGPVSIAIGESIDFHYYYTADSVGEVYWELRTATEDSTLFSATIMTDLIYIQDQPDYVYTQMINSMPTAVTKGQQNIFPFSLILEQPDTSSALSTIVIDTLRLHIIDDANLPVMASEVLSRAVLSSGYTILSVIDSIEDQSNILFEFDESIYISPGEEIQFTLLVDIDSSATEDDFKIAINSENDLPLYDKNLMLPIPTDTSTIFPLRTDVCRIDEPSQYMAISFESLTGSTVNYGQDDVKMIMFRVNHPGETGSSQIQLSRLSLHFTETGIDSLQINELIDRICLKQDQNIIAEIESFVDSDSVLDINLTAPISLFPGEYDSIYVYVDVKDDTPYETFAVSLANDSDLTVRDNSSGQTISVIGDALQTNHTFPMTSAFTSPIYPAVNPKLCIAETAPGSVVTGADEVELCRFDLYYDAPDGYSSIKLDKISTLILDSVGAPLDPIRLFDQIGFSINGLNVDYQEFIQIYNGKTIFELGDNGQTLTPGDSLIISLFGDIEADLDYSDFALVLESSDAFALSDSNDSSNVIIIENGSACEIVFPYTAASVDILSAAGRPIVDIDGSTNILAHANQDEVLLYSGDLTYNIDQSAGSLILSSMYATLLERTAEGASSVSVNQLFSRATLYIDDNAVAIDSTMLGDSLVLEFESDLIIENGSDLTLELRADISSNASLGNYYAILGDSEFVSLSDNDLGMTKYPIVNRSYPIKSNEISIVPIKLESSFTNYPNPFNPDIDVYTTIGFALEEPAYIDIELFTITGDLVKIVTANSYRSIGAYQQDIWQGKNGADLSVLPGTYYCRITAKYDSGREESFRRKISIIR